MVGAGLITTRISNVSPTIDCVLGITVIIRNSVMLVPRHMRVGMIMLT